MLTVFGVVVLSFMMLMYPLERRGSRFVLAFACGCAVASVYGFLAGTWPFGVVELAWAGIATRRYLELRRNVTHRVAGVRKSHSPGRVSESLA